MVKLASIMAVKLCCEVNWKYFATSHGKGVVDGIGGSAKSLVRTKVMSKGEDALIVQTLTDFATAAKCLMPEVTVLHVSQEEISETILSDDPWSSVQSRVFKELAKSII